MSFYNEVLKCLLTKSAYELDEKKKTSPRTRRQIVLVLWLPLCIYTKQVRRITPKESK